MGAEFFRGKVAKGLMAGPERFGLDGTLRMDSGVELFFEVLRGGAIGPGTSPLGGRGGLIDCSAAKAFLECVLRFGCRWYMSSQAKQNVWLEQGKHRTMASAVPQRSQTVAPVPKPDLLPANGPISS